MLAALGRCVTSTESTDEVKVDIKPASVPRLIYPLFFKLFGNFMLLGRLSDLWRSTAAAKDCKSLLFVFESGACYSGATYKFIYVSLFFCIVELELPPLCNLLEPLLLLLLRLVLGMAPLSGDLAMLPNRNWFYWRLCWLIYRTRLLERSPALSRDRHV